MERREARASDRKEAQHARQTISHIVCCVQGGFASRSRGLARPGIWRRSAPSSGERGEAAQSSGANAPRERARISVSIQLVAAAVAALLFLKAHV